MPVKQFLSVEGLVRVCWYSLITVRYNVVDESSFNVKSIVPLFELLTRCSIVKMKRPMTFIGIYSCIRRFTIYVINRFVFSIGVS